VAGDGRKLTTHERSERDDDSVRNQTHRAIGYIKLVQPFTLVATLRLVVSSQKYQSLGGKDTIPKDANPGTLICRDPDKSQAQATLRLTLSTLVLSEKKRSAR